MIDDILDYAMPLMTIERVAREIHDLCLDNRYEEARDLTLQLSIESRILRAALAHLNEKEKGFATTETLEDWQDKVRSRATAHLAAPRSDG